MLYADDIILLAETSNAVQVLLDALKIINLSIVNKYTYVGIVFTEHLDYNLSAKCAAQSASRARGLLIG